VEVAFLPPRKFFYDRHLVFSSYEIKIYDFRIAAGSMKYLLSSIEIIPSFKNFFWWEEGWRGEQTESL
jgi:hypothetical protein